MDFAFGNNNQLSSIELLDVNEMEATQGKIFPFWLLGFAVRFTANPLIRHYVSSGSLAYGVYSWAHYMHRR